MPKNAFFGLFFEILPAAQKVWPKQGLLVVLRKCSENQSVRLKKKSIKFLKVFWKSASPRENPRSASALESHFLGFDDFIETFATLYWLWYFQVVLLRNLISPWISFKVPDIPPVHHINVHNSVPKNYRVIKKQSQTEVKVASKKDSNNDDNEEVVWCFFKINNINEINLVSKEIWCYLN